MSINYVNVYVFYEYQAQIQDFGGHAKLGVWGQKCPENSPCNEEAFEINTWQQLLNTVF